MVIMGRRNCLAAKKELQRRAAGEIMAEICVYKWHVYRTASESFNEYDIVL